MQKIIYFLLALCLPCVPLCAEITYHVAIKGTQDTAILAPLESASKLLRLTSRPPQSTIALKRRAEADVSTFIKVLQGMAYYHPQVDLQIDTSTSPVSITFTVNTGPIYPLADFRLRPGDNESHDEGFCLKEITLQDLGLTLGEPAYPQSIIKAETTLLHIMAEKGYPLAFIAKRDVIANEQQKDVHVTLYVHSGSKATFGTTTVSGTSTVKEEFFKNKITWHEGEAFDVQKVTETQEALENSGLFRSVTITHGQEIASSSSLPMEIQVVDAKQRSIGAGAGYTTQQGLGATFEWDHRNVRGLGERVSLHANVWKNTQEAKISYMLPDFGQKGQKLTWQAGIDHEKIKAYTKTSWQLSGTIDKEVHEGLHLSYGGMYESIVTSRSDNNGIFHLLKAPVHLRWSTADSLLNPTTGHTINFKMAPTLQLASPQFVYCPTTWTTTFYKPLTEDRKLIIAGKATLGSIFGASRHAIPPSERFYAGNENTLRGYKYLTVSPLDHKNEPIGGKSIAVGSIELRAKLTDKLEGVGFYEIGNVYSGSTPQLNSKQLQSAGAGLRYHTPVGPIRFDVAFPLNRRKGIDSSVQVYMSIGQSF